MNKGIRISLVGARGRMGRAIIDVAANEPDIEIVAGCDVGDSIEEAASKSNVIVDFSQALAIDEICRVAEKTEQALVIGTTGHSAQQRQVIDAVAKAVPIVFASNFSVGVNVLFALAGQTARLLDEKFQIRITETHHTKKKDAPSGTAKTLSEIVRAARKFDQEIPIELIREGDVVGDHTVSFDRPGERLELTHRASSREIFAQGALRAAEWVVGKPPGLYSMQDVLGL